MKAAPTSDLTPLGVTDFWELARQAKADVASGQTRASVEALISHLRHVIGSGLDVAAATDFVAVAFAREAFIGAIEAEQKEKGEAWVRRRRRDARPCAHGHEVPEGPRFSSSR
jgi:hypothetical protein